MFLIKYSLRLFVLIAHKFLLKKRLVHQKRLRANRRVIIQINSGIGDAIRALPMIHVLRVNGYEIYAVVNNLTRPVAQLCPDILKEFVVRLVLRTLFSDLKALSELYILKCRYYVGALGSNVIRFRFIPLLLNIPVSAKHMIPPKELYRNYDFLSNILEPWDTTKNNTETNLLLVSRLNGYLREPSAIRYNIVLSTIRTDEVRSRLKALGFIEEKISIGVHPGCKDTHLFKRWPAENYSLLIDRLLDSHGDVQIIVFGGHNEIPLANKIVKQTIGKPLNCVGEFTLHQTMCAIRLCRLFVSNDSGLMHIATAFNIPVVAIMGGMSKVTSGPYGHKHIVIRKADIADIQVDEAYQAVTRQMQLPECSTASA